MNKLIPVPDVLLVWSFLRSCLQRFNLAWRSNAYFSLLDWVLSQRGVGEQVLEMIRGLSYTIAPLSPLSHPPCSVLFDSTEHEGWELIELTLMYIRQD